MTRPDRQPFAAIALLLMSVHLLSACRGSAEQLQAAAKQDARATELGQLRDTATVSRARMQITLDYAGTRVAQAEQAGTFLRSNLREIGQESAFIEENLRILRSQVPTAIEVRPAATLNAASPAIEAPTAIIQPEASGPRLEGLVLAAGIGADGCAVDVNPVFTPQSEEIRVFARAYSIPDDSTLRSIWRRQRQEAAVIPNLFERVMDGSCIWFYIDQSDAAFTAGDWSVEIRLDGEALAPALGFQIVDG